jgi:hypothetical protein|tara:strand:+ start:323 stop:484 length:162 start_codon:yes stop_codon:yes gene_type:complete
MFCKALPNFDKKSSRFREPFPYVSFLHEFITPSLAGSRLHHPEYLTKVQSLSM